MSRAAPLMGALYGDAGMAALLSEPAALAAMLRVESALARAQAAVGDIPAAAAEAIAATAGTLTPAPDELVAGAATAGIAAAGARWETGAGISGTAAGRRRSARR